MGWFQADGRLVPQVAQLLQRLTTAGEADGLDPQRYHPERLHHQVGALDTLRAEVAAGADSLALINLMRSLDLNLTGTFLALLGDQVKGAADPALNSAKGWSERRKKVSLWRQVEALLAKTDTAATTHAYSVRNQHPEYARLQVVYKAYRELAKKGGWGYIQPRSQRLDSGATDARFVRALRRRLRSEAAAIWAVSVADKDTLKGYARNAQGLLHDLTARNTDSTTYDSVLVRIVKRFQARHGLPADGVIGKGTVAAMNVPVTQRLRQLRANMERWRWLPQRTGRRYLLVNIADYRLHLVEDGTEQLTMRVIVGQRQKATPLFADRVDFVVLAPYWNVPASIVVEEIRPALKRNPKYLERENMEVVNRRDQVVDPTKIEWDSVNWSPGGRYRVRQRPGGENPLGPIKFLLPNDEDVYLHGTPNQGLFDQKKRQFSHGCVRVEDPWALAEALLKTQSEWTPERLREVVDAGEQTWIVLKRPIPVFLLYLTAWIEPDGTVCFRDDVYGHDWRLTRALGSSE